MRVLLIEDHKPLVRALKQGLEEEQFAVDVAYDGEEGAYKAETATYDVIILDLMLPKEDGLSLLQRWRRGGMMTHVLVLTARGGIEDKVRGLDLGADDYLAKPFELKELLAHACPGSPGPSSQGPRLTHLRSGNRHDYAHRQTLRQGDPPDSSRVRLAAIPGFP